jgi:KUP system potassium uptake protein
MNNAHKDLHTKWTLGGLLISLGIIFGDIGTSPLYVMKAILGDHISADIVLGGICIWTDLLTTIKYVIITLNADNHGWVICFIRMVKKDKNSMAYSSRHHWEVHCC